MTNESNYDIFAPKVSGVINNVTRIIDIIKPEIKEDTVPIIDEVFDNRILVILNKN